VDLHVFKSSKCRDGPDCRVAHSRGKSLCKVKARTLGIALGHKSCLEALHRSIYVPLDLEDPLGAYYLSARGKFDNLPSPIPVVGLKFFKPGLLPLAGLRKPLRLLEGPGLRDGGKVGIGSGVEGFIRVSSRIMRLVFFLILLILLILLLILLWRVLNRKTIVFIIRGDGRSGVSVLPDGWG